MNKYTRFETRQNNNEKAINACNVSSRICDKNDCDSGIYSWKIWKIDDGANVCFCGRLFLWTYVCFVDNTGGIEGDRLGNHEMNGFYHQ